MICLQKWIVRKIETERLSIVVGSARMWRNKWCGTNGLGLQRLHVREKSHRALMVIEAMSPFEVGRVIGVDIVARIVPVPGIQIDSSQSRINSRLIHYVGSRVFTPNGPKRTSLVSSRASLAWTALKISGATVMATKKFGLNWKSCHWFVAPTESL